MERFRINFYITGVDDIYIDKVDTNIIDILRKGSLCNKRTNRKYDKNILKKTIYFTYKDGIEPHLHKLIEFINNNKNIMECIINSQSTSLQICIDIDDESEVRNIPSIYISPENLDFFAKIHSDIEFQIW